MFVTVGNKFQITPVNPSLGWKINLPNQASIQEIDTFIDILKIY